MPHTVLVFGIGSEQVKHGPCPHGAYHLQIITTVLSAIENRKLWMNITVILP